MAGKKKVVFLINPRTGENVAKLPAILPILAAAGWDTTIKLKEYGRHIMQLAHNASDHRRDLVIAYGGDGTLNQVVNGVMSTKGHTSTVGILPGGTANVWAGEIGVPNDPIKAALTLVNSEERKVDVGRTEVVSLTFPGEDTPTPVHSNPDRRATRKSQSVRHHFLLMAGLGIDAAVMGAVSKPLKYRVGPIAVGLSAAQKIPEQRAFPIEIQAVGPKSEAQPLWKGEALQVVIGNTRRYARYATMTPDAYIDDGALEVCVITAGTPLSTMQQISSLLLRLKPDTTTAEYFHGQQLRISVPATVPFQVDGSPVKLKDYLSSHDYKKVQQIEEQEQVIITYQFDAVPKALRVAIPCTYNDELFEHTADKHHKNLGTTPAHGKHRHDDEGPAETILQQRTEEAETQPESQLDHKIDDEQAQQHAAEMRRELPDLVQSLTENGKKFTVSGKTPDPAQPQTYILAGSVRSSSTGEAIPAAIVVNAETTVFDREGQRVSDIDSAVRELLEGAVIIVEGRRNKRSVIHATRLVL